jgi:hypothetical protein
VKEPPVAVDVRSGDLVEPLNGEAIRDVWIGDDKRKGSAQLVARKRWNGRQSADHECVWQPNARAQQAVSFGGR